MTHAAAGTLRGRSDMRQQEGVLQCPVARVEIGLTFEDVEPGGGNFTALNGGNQVGREGAGQAQYVVGKDKRPRMQNLVRALIRK